MRGLYKQFIQSIVKGRTQKEIICVPDYYTRSASKQIDIRTIEPFSSLARKVIADRKTYLYFDRLYQIYQSLLNIQRIDHSDMNVAEVGVYRGGGSYFIASTLEDLGMKKVGVLCFDTFEGHDETDISERNDNRDVHVPLKFSDTSLESVSNYLEPFKMIDLYKGRIQDTALQVQDKRFGFIHIDVDLYEPTLFALNFFDKRLVNGGMILVDDFDCITCVGVRKAVEKFIAQNHGYAMYAMLSAQCLLVKYR